jgi:hypothetical protein
VSFSDLPVTGPGTPPGLPDLTLPDPGEPAWEWRHEYLTEMKD